MKTRTIFFLLCFCVGNLKAQVMNRSDEKGKQGHWTYYGRDRPETGIPDSGKVEEGSYTDNRKEGWWVKYHNDGITPKLIGSYANNRPCGRYYKFNANGTLRETSIFWQDKYRDTLRTYDEQGDPKDVIVYDIAGVEKSVILRREPAHVPSEGCGGPVAHRPVYTDTIPAPDQEVFAPASAAVTDDYHKIFNSDKEIWMDGTFKAGKLWDGKVYIYDRDGILLKVSLYKSGKYCCEGNL